MDFKNNPFLKAIKVVFPYGLLIVSIAQIVEIDAEKLEKLYTTNKELLFNQVSLWGLLWTFTIVVALFLISARKKHRNSPITVKNATIKIVYNDLVGADVSVEYAYLFRVNHDDVDAICTFQNPSGEIPEKSISTTLTGNRVVADDIEPTIKHKNSKEWEIIHKASSHLPKQNLIEFFKGQFLTYTCSCQYLNSFKNKMYENYDFTVGGHYSFKQITLELHIPREVDIKQCNFYERQAASLKYETVSKSHSDKQGYDRYCITKDIPQNVTATYRLIWKQ